MEVAPAQQPVKIIPESTAVAAPAPAATKEETETEGKEEKDDSDGDADDDVSLHSLTSTLAVFLVIPLLFCLFTLRVRW